MNTKIADKIFRMIFIFVFVVGTVWMPGTSAGANPQAITEFESILVDETTPMFADDFNDGDALGWLELLWNNVGPWTVVDGVYTSASEYGAAESFVHVNDASWTDYVYTGKFKLNGASEASILFRVQDAGDGYYDSGDYQQVVNHPDLNCIALFYIRDGLASYTACESYQFDPNAWYAFEIMVRGSSITYSINDVEVKTWDMANQYWGTEYNSFGGIGVKMARPVGGVQYDDILVMQYERSELTLEKSVSPTTYNQAGDVINYSYLLTNTGSGTLSGPFTVMDDKTTVACPNPARPFT